MGNEETINPQSWVQYLANRLSERSTWLGILTIAGTLGYGVNPEMLEIIVQGGTFCAGAILTLTKDKK